MNRTVHIFATAMTLLLPVFAVDLVDTNITAAGNTPGDNALYIASDGPHSVSGSSLTGGASLDITDATTTASAYGGNGIQVTVFLPFISNRIVDMDSSTFTGGAGGTVTVDNLAVGVNAYGGVGVGSLAGELYLSNSSAYGGQGGTLVANSGSQVVNVDGGDAVYATEGFVIADGLYALGGQGGSANASGADSASSANGGNGIALSALASANSVVNSEVAGGAGMYFDNGSGSASANGGDGIWASDISGLLTISNTTATGGTGGTVLGTGEGLSADGGDGLAISNSIVEIYGGNFSGGAAGTTNGVSGEAGYAARFSDVGLTVQEDAIFSGRGVLIDSATSNSIKISSGTFSAIELSGDSKIDITGGTFESGLLFSGTGEQELSIMSVDTSGDIIVSETKLTVTDWDEDVFKDVLVSSGEINFKNSDFNLQNGDSFTLDAEDASANFYQNLGVSGSLDLGLGSINVGSNLTIKSGADITSSIMVSGSGTTGGVITANSGDIADDITWTVVNADTNMTKENLQDGYGILLVSATETNVDENLTFGNFKLENNPEWLFGINGVTNVQEGSSYNLYATYGQLDLSKVFEDYDGLVDAMSQLGPIVIEDEGLSEYVSTTWGDIQAAADDLEQGFVRTPEMANALIGLQSVFADQVKERTRSSLRYKNFGSKTTYSPAGANGPAQAYDSSVQWTEDNLPTYDAKGAVRSASDSAPMPNFKGEPAAVSKAYNTSSGGKGSEYNEFQTQLRTRTPTPEPIEIPETYQIWGRAYGAHADQDGTDGHRGYDVTYAGGVVGLDKRYEKMLVGLGGGYARTKMEGKGGNDGDADTLHLMGYWAHNTESFYVDAMVNYAYNDVQTEGVDTIDYTAAYDAHTVGLSLGVGYGISFFKDKWLFTPEASYLGTYFSRGSYTEESQLSTPFPDKKYDSYDQWSHLTSVGATLSMIGVIESFETELEFQPEIRVHWLHEFNADMDNDSYLMQGGSGDPIAVALQAREEDLLRLGAGVRIAEWMNDTTSFSFDVDSAIGENYYNVIVSGRVMHRF